MYIGSIFCLRFRATFQCEKLEARTDNEFLTQLSGSQKLRKTEFTWKAETQFSKFFLAFETRKLKCHLKAIIYLAF